MMEYHFKIHKEKKRVLGGMPGVGGMCHSSGNF